MRLLALLAMFLACAGVLAQTKFGQPPVTAPAAPAASAPAAVDPNFQPLAERKDVVSWRLLAQVELVKTKERYEPQFASGVSALNAKEVKIQGFMMPLEMGDKQSHFILSSTPQSCAFCMPGGPESLVEVKMKKPIAYGMEPLVLTGKLAVMKDDPTGVFYRLTEAVPTK
jgi:hypothetical protein